MLRKIAITNRSKIAACAEIGIRSVAIYSAADRFALRVKKTDAPYCIGSEALAGYLLADPHHLYERDYSISRD